jgi:hypothetical protein
MPAVGERSVSFAVSFAVFFSLNTYANLSNLPVVCMSALALLGESQDLRV